jgi:cytochrome P450
MSCLVQRTRRGLNTGKDKQKYLLPPIAPYSFLDSLRAATSGNIAWFLRQVCGEMGHLCRLRFLIPGSIVYVSSDADVNREILTDPTTKKSPKLKNFNQITAGVSNFFTSNGYRFYHARKAMAPAFANNHIKRMDQVTIAKTEEWIQHRLEELVKSGQPVDINKEMVDLTLAVILEAAFEYDMSEKEQEELMTCVHVTLTTFVFPNPFKMWFWFLFPSIWEAHRKAREMMQIAKNIIEAYKHNRSPTKGTVIDLIMSNPNYNNDDERAADVVDLIIAGHETSANSMTFLLLELAKNPKEQSRLQQELQGMDPEDRKKSEHLKNCIKEGMRIWPVSAPGPIRVAGRDYIVPISTHDSSSSKHGDAQNDFVIPQGSLVFMPMISLAHNPRYFDDPLTFMPSRWESPTEAMKKAFMPFSTGKRNCLGQSLANSEMQFILSRLCVQYNFEVVEEGTTGYFITLKPVGTLLKATRI